MITGLDHLVLTVVSVENTIVFYEMLGMEAVRFGRDGERRALRFGEQKINLHEAGRGFEPKAANPLPGSADLCFIVDVPVATLAGMLRERGLCVELGPVERSGARGPLLSIYTRDPDGNLVELANPLP